MIQHTHSLLIGELYVLCEKCAKNAFNDGYKLYLRSKEILMVVELCVQIIHILFDY